MRRVLLAALLTLGASVMRGQCSANNWYVAVNGASSNNGSINSPWTYDQARNPPGVVHAGDTIWFRGGTYNMPNIPDPTVVRSWYGSGTASCPLKIRAYQPGTYGIPERVIITASNTNALYTAVATIYISCSYCWFWGMEVTTSSNQNRLSQFPGDSPPDILYGDSIDVRVNNGNLPGIKIIDTILHDTRQGIGAQAGTNPNLEANFNLIFYNGWDAPDRGHGHGHYWQTQISGDIHQANHEMSWANMGYGFQAYGSSDAYERNYQFHGGTYWQSGAISTHGSGEIVIGGTDPAYNLSMDNVRTYSPGGGDQFLIGWPSYPCGPSCVLGASITNSYIASNPVLQQIAIPSGIAITNTTFIYNQITGFAPANYPTSTFITPRTGYGTGQLCFVDLASYQPGLGSVTIYNWTLQNTVSCNVSSILTVGSAYQVVNAADYLSETYGPGSPVLSGVYAGGNLTFPMTGLTQAAVVGTGAQTPTNTWPKFAVFIIQTTAQSTTPTTTATKTNTPTFTTTQTPTGTLTPTVTPSASATKTPTQTSTVNPLTAIPTATPPPCIIINIGGVSLECIAKPLAPQ